ncbi:hypothetical protein ACO0SA_001728 [Hanseniaspora valbyensis]
MSKNLILVDVTQDKDCVKYCHTENSVTWGGKPYTIEQYVEREKILGEQAICLNPKIDASLGKYRKYLGIRYYAFKDLSLPDTGKCSQIVSALETLNRVAYIKKPNSDQEIPILSVAIGGVYTPQKFRGKRYASSMMSALNKFYDDIASKHPQDSFLKYTTIFLYSEVGGFYEKFEYASRHVPIHYFENDSKLLNYIESLRESTKKVVPLVLEDINSNLVTCLKAEEEECEKASKHPQISNKYKFYIKPDVDIYRWFKARDKYTASIISSKLISEKPLIDGFKVEDSKSHIIWHHSWNEDKLYVLNWYIENDSKDDAVILLIKAFEEMENYKIKKLAVWDEDLSGKTLKSIFKNIEEHDSVHIGNENSSLSAIRAKWLEDINELVWTNNGKSSWF